MGQTITEKILAAHCGKKVVVPGEFIEPKVDISLSNDVTAPLAIKEYLKTGKKHVFDKNKIALVMDHFTPNKDIKSAENVKFVREFAKKEKIKHYYEGGNVGIEHALLPEKGIVVPGDIVIGADSHTCTYGALGAFSTGVGSTDVGASLATGKVWLKVPQTIKFVYKGKLNKFVSGKDLILYTIGKIGVDGALYQTMEFTGETVKKLKMADRLTMANMAIEAGAKNGIFPVDDVTLDYLHAHGAAEPTVYAADADAEYEETIEVDLSEIEPTVAFPHLPENTRPFD
ncbi:MAG: 3-isopropylmalate dehydratase large subunit, partial [Elusimicrobia bacterium]|nr:3-isopropylmalate dehydratase large subunit [Elusimicrobiota bacterium]